MLLIADYCDTHKNKHWQPYASAVAAAYVKDLLSFIPVTKVEKKDVNDHEKRTEFLRALYTCPYEERKDRNHGRVDGTCLWFTEHLLFRNWFLKDSSLLWASADPGCGKSVLAKYLIDVYLPTGNATTPRTICYFFFKDDVLDQRSAIDALRAVIRQLFKQQRHLLQKHLLDRYAEDGNRLFKSFQGLFSIFLNACNDPAASDVICVLDALDECQKDEAEQLIRAICGVHLQQRCKKLKFLITSRPYSYIQEAFSTLKDQLSIIHLAGEKEEESELISEEINLFIDHRLHILAEQKDLSPRDSELLQMTLKGVRNRTYLWVYLVFAHLEDTLNVKNIRIKDTLKELPGTVNEAYESLLDRATDGASTRMLLKAILVAQRPLNLDDADILLSLEIGMSEEDLPSQVRRNSQVVRRIRSMCGLFIVVVYGQLFLFHQTAREFLLTKVTQNSVDDVQPIIAISGVHQPPLKWQGAFNIQESHTLLAHKCIQYLLTAGHSCSFSSLTYTHKETFRYYAYTYWDTHLRASALEGQSIISRKAVQLCNLISNFQTKCPCLMLYSHHLAIFAPEQISLSQHSLALPAFFGLVDVLKLLLPVESSNKLAKSDALRLAIRHKHTDAVELLVQHKADPNFIFRRSDFLPTAYANILYKPKIQNTTCLHEAVRLKNLRMISVLLNWGADVNLQDSRGYSSLHVAVAPERRSHRYPDDKVSFDTIKLLLSSKAKILAKDHRGWTPLAVFVMEYYEQEVDMATTEVVFGNLCKRGTRIDERFQHRGICNHYQLSDPQACLTTMLLGAAGRAREHCVQLLLSQGAKPTTEDSLNHNLLHWSAYGGSLSLMSLALAKDLPVESKNIYGRTPIMFCAMNLNKNATKLLLNAGADINASDHQGKKPLMYAAASIYGDKDASYAELCLEAGAEVNAVDSQDKTALMYAAAAELYWQNKSLFLLTLINAGARIDSKDQFGNTCLHYAAKGAFYPHVKLFLLSGADVNSKNANGHTPIFLACHGWHMDKPMLLQDSDWKHSDRRDVIALLTENGARPCEGCNEP